MFLAFDIVRDVLHECTQLLQYVVFLSGWHFLLTQKKSDNSAQILRSNTGISRCRVMLLQQRLDITHQFGGKL